MLSLGKKSLCAWIPRLFGELYKVSGDAPEAPVSTTGIDISPNERKIKGGLTLWKFDKHFFCSWIYSRMRRGPEDEGRWNLSHEVGKDYCQQITAEEMVVKPTGHIVWVKRNRNNHYLDAEVHARVAAHILNVDLLIKARNKPVPGRKIIRRVK